MDIIFVLTSSAFLLWIIRNSIYWVSLWQAKEYRFQRLFIHMRETAQGRLLLFSPFSLLKWAAVVFYGFTIFHDTYLDEFHFFVTALYVFEAFLVLKELLFNQLRRPEFTPKAISLIGTSIIFSLLLFSIPLLDRYFWLLLIDRSLFVIVGFMIFLHSFPTELYYDTQISKAMKKIAEHKDLMVIAITGSYGKSSTKEFLAQILGTKFAVIKTRGNQHTLGGIASVIVQKLSKKTQMFVVEIGGYEKGEVAQIAHIIKPNIGILTGINDQHLSLFKTLTNSIETKYELIEALPKKGLALFNGNDEAVRKLAKKTKMQTVLYGYDLSDQEAPDRDRAISATNIHVDREHVTFTVKMKKQSFLLRAPLLGSYNIANLLPAIYLADFCGMTQSEIKRAVARLTPLPNTMTRHLGEKGITIIDDTLNSNPESVKAAVDYMRIYRKKRFLVFQPMIELGHNAKEHHVALGRTIAHVCHVVLVTNNNFLKDIQKGISDEKGTCKVIGGTIKTLTVYLQKHAGRGDIVVCEGNEARNVFEKIIQEK